MAARWESPAGQARDGWRHGEGPAADAGGRSPAWRQDPSRSHATLATTADGPLATIDGGSCGRAPPPHDDSLDRAVTEPTRPSRDLDPYVNLRDLGRRARRRNDPGQQRAAGVEFTPGLRRRWPRRFLVAANLFAAVALISAGAVFGYVNWRVSQIHKEQIGALSASTSKAFTMLVVGSDSRGLKPGPCDDAGTAQQTPGQRSDTIMLVRVVPGKHQLALMSIPRDLWVPIQGMGSNRINTAFNNGPNLLVQTIQSDLGIPINHYAEVNFDTFCDVTNAVGGVKFWFPTPARDTMSDLSVPQAGCVNLTGQQALAFVRSRHYEYYQNGQWHFEGESDLARIQRQQTFVKKMIHKAAGEYTNPIAINNVIGGVTKNLTVDSGMSTGTMIELAKDFRSVDAAGIPSETLPTYGFTTSGGAQVLGLQQPQAQQTIAAFNALGTTPSSTTTSPAHHKSTTPAASPTTTVAPASVSIKVVNGSGIAGQAGQVAQHLQSLGYRASIGSSPGAYGNNTTVVKYAPDAQAAARQVAAQIQGGATLVEDPSLTPTNYNLEVVTGSSYSGPGGTATAGTASSGSTSTAPATSTPATPQPYVLPGTPSGQVPPANC